MLLGKMTKYLMFPKKMPRIVMSIDKMTEGKMAFCPYFGPAVSYKRKMLYRIDQRWTATKVRRKIVFRTRLCPIS